MRQCKKGFRGYSRGPLGSDEQGAGRAVHHAGARGEEEDPGGSGGAGHGPAEEGVREIGATYLYMREGPGREMRTAADEAAVFLCCHGLYREGPGLFSSMRTASFDQSKESRFMICERIVRIAAAASSSFFIV